VKTSNIYQIQKTSHTPHHKEIIQTNLIALVVSLQDVSSILESLLPLGEGEERVRTLDAEREEVRVVDDGLRKRKRNDRKGMEIE
jgi:hypothetical protein